jgi:hypothetical protein
MFPRKHRCPIPDSLPFGSQSTSGYLAHRLATHLRAQGTEKLPCDLSLSAKLLLIERVLKPPNEPAPGKFMDLQRLVVAPGGRERAEADYQTLLREAGFTLERVIPTTGPLSINESRPTPADRLEGKTQLGTDR